MLLVEPPYKLSIMMIHGDKYKMFYTGIEPRIFDLWSHHLNNLVVLKFSRFWPPKFHVGQWTWTRHLPKQWQLKQNNIGNLDKFSVQFVSSGFASINLLSNYELISKRHSITSMTRLRWSDIQHILQTANTLSC